MLSSKGFLKQLLNQYQVDGIECPKLVNLTRTQGDIARPALNRY